MEPSDQQRLKGFLVRGLFLGGTLLVMAWCAPYMITSVQNQSKPKPKNVRSVIKPASQLERILHDFKPKPAHKKVKDGVHHWLFNQSPKEALQLQVSLREHEIEAYMIELDGIDAELRIYSAEKLSHQLLFKPNLPPPNKTSVAEKRKRPQIAIIVAGLGQRDVQKISRHQLPLTLAIEPAKPFSLRIAADAAKNSQEIMIDLRSSNISPKEAIQSLPYHSGLLTTHRLALTTPQRLQSYLYISNESQPNDSPFLPVQYHPHLSTEQLTNRIMHLAQKHERSAFLIDFSDNRLDSILEWAGTIESHGYRLVFANEISRWKESRGVDSSRN